MHERIVFFFSAKGSNILIHEYMNKSSCKMNMEAKRPIMLFDKYIYKWKKLTNINEIGLSQIISYYCWLQSFNWYVFWFVLEMSPKNTKQKRNLSTSTTSKLHFKTFTESWLYNHPKIYKVFKNHDMWKQISTTQNLVEDG